LFVAINWNAGGGGAFAVIPHKNVGKSYAIQIMLFDEYYRFNLLDTDFATFNDYVIASGSEDSKVMIWNIPEELGEPESPDIAPVAKLNGHGRKVGHVLFHPVADNVLASTSADLTVKLWDIEKGQEKQTLQGFLDFIQSISWNYNGSLLATTCRDKKLRIFDVRSGNVVQEASTYKVSSNTIEPISFVVPRRSDAFQSDLFPPALSGEPALSADEFFGGKNAKPKTISLEHGFQAKGKKEFVSSAPKEEEPVAQTPKTEKEYQDAYHQLRQENDDLRNQLAQRDVTIRALTIQLEQLKTGSS
ncbi:1232_t:CDS:2, partial [Racocetra fulgida]